MKNVIAVMILAAFVTVSGAPVATAQSRGRGPKPAVAHAPKTATSQGHGPKTTTARAPKSTTSHGPKTTTNRAPQASPGKPAAKPTTATNVPRNSRQVERLRVLLNLPEGTDMTPYAAGFRNQGQFVAAVHVSNNLGLTFSELKTLMVDQHLSLGQAIQQLRPDVNANAEVRRANSQSQQQ